MFKFIKSLKYSEDPELIKLKAHNLVRYGSKQAFAMFKDEEIRAGLDFDKQTQVEQDRFFNEMVVTNIIMLMLLLDQRIAVSDPGIKRTHFKALRKEVPLCYGRDLKKYGIEDEHIKTWKKLIDMRYDEYSKDKLEWRKMIAEMNPKIGYNNELAIFQALAIGLYDHLKRGQIKKGDPLYKKIQFFILPVYKHLKRKLA